jgi:hypothetical protein
MRLAAGFQRGIKFMIHQRHLVVSVAAGARRCFTPDDAALQQLSTRLWRPWGMNKDLPVCKNAP